MKKKFIILLISIALFISACNHEENADSNQSSGEAFSDFLFALLSFPY